MPGPLLAWEQYLEYLELRRMRKAELESQWGSQGYFCSWQPLFSIFLFTGTLLHKLSALEYFWHGQWSPARSYGSLPRSWNLHFTEKSGFLWHFVNMLQRWPQMAIFRLREVLSLHPFCVLLVLLLNVVPFVALCIKLPLSSVAFSKIWRYVETEGEEVYRSCCLLSCSCT